MGIKDYRRLSWVVNSHSSTGGKYLKSECIISGIKYFYKLSQMGYYSFTSHESVLEVIASRIGLYLGLPVLKYTGAMARIIIDNKEYVTYVCRSQNYVPAGYSAMAIHRFVALNKPERLSHIEYMHQLGFEDYMNYMFIFDYLIMNVDRHGRNIEMLISYDNKYRVSPLFDNGRCLTFDRGNNDSLISTYNYQEQGMANNYFGGIYLEANLRYVTKAYRLPRLTPEARKKIFYGLSGVLSKLHMDIIWRALVYRYNRLLEKGIII